ncbi:FMN-dependent NADH-azoreductase [Bacillus sp. FJAT-27264]|uniref:FMN-dependent NADH-azoreductase n=1 Tax=Paenibacillus sp. (strain DSM 101736 / FJAT-27264) TaxID=1850362 RepID=UPI000807D3B4|nr:FMN-dependent NADH-azoreductase [Bacillus sp. FJAT-27264]OBZ14852.1 FMN-dependent NADH-azoreductase [Bacillus sp. FJAT-27264]
MANVLFVKVNDRPAEQAVSVKMYEAFLGAYKESHPQDAVTELDLYEANLPYYGNTAITGLYKISQGWDLTPEEASLTATVNGYLDQFLAADKVVIAFPLWNFMAPAPLITYISYLAQAGKTFKYTSEGPVGLAGDKKVVLLNARGGVYSSEPMSALESAVKPVKTALGMFGIQAEEIIIEGHNQIQDRSEAIIAEGLEQVAKVAATF